MQVHTAEKCVTKFSFLVSLLQYKNQIPPPFKYCAIESLLTENNSMFLYYFRCVVGTNASNFEFSVAKLTRLNRCLCLSRAMALGCCPGSLLRRCSLDGT